METDEPQPTGEPANRSKRWWIREALTIVLVVGFITSLVAVPYYLTRRVPYYLLSPGPTRPVESLLVVPSDKKMTHQGSFYFTTVNESSGRLFRLEYWYYKWKKDKNNQIEHAQDVEQISTFDCGAASSKTYQQDTMTESQRAAVSVALRRVGLPVTTTSKVQISMILKGSAADGKLSFCDYITAVDGNKMDTGSALRAYIRSKKPGDIVHVDVLTQNGATKEVDVKLASTSDGVALLGVVPDEANSHLSVVSPLKVGFSKTDIGGPSAGLAFSLAIIDDLTPGNLAGNQKVAATGEMLLNGSVWPIGGIKEKLASVHRQGIKLFIVPRDNYEEAMKTKPADMTIVPVSTLEEALTALKTHGGDTSSLPSAPDLSQL